MGVHQHVQREPERRAASAERQLLRCNRVQRGPVPDSRDLTAASVEPGEPLTCGASFPKSAWYAGGRIADQQRPPTRRVGGEGFREVGVRFLRSDGFRLEIAIPAGVASWLRPRVRGGQISQDPSRAAGAATDRSSTVRAGVRPSHGRGLFEAALYVGRLSQENHAGALGRVGADGTATFILGGQIGRCRRTSCACTPRGTTSAPPTTGLPPDRQPRRRSRSGR